MLTRKSGKQIAAGLAGLTFILSGCSVDVYSPPPRERVYVERAPREQVYVQEAPQPDAVVVEEPPQPQPDVVIGVAPGPDYAWVGGEYIIGGGRYQWRQGHWDHAPRGHRTWVRGHVERHGRGYVHVEGHWE